MRDQLNQIIDIWSDFYKPKVQESEIEALKNTIYSMVTQYKEDNKFFKNKWKD